MLQLKYSLNSLNNLVWLPSGSRFLSLGVSTLPNKTQQPFAKFGIPRHNANFATQYRSYGNRSVDTANRTPLDLIRVALVADASEFDYIAYLDHRPNEGLQCLGSIVLRDKSYTGYMVYSINSETSQNTRDAGNARIANTPVNESALTRNIL